MKGQIQNTKFKQLLKLVNECHLMCVYLCNRFPQESNLISSKEIVEKHNISNRTLQRFRTSGKLVPIARGRSYLYQTEEVEEFFKAYRSNLIHLK